MRGKTAEVVNVIEKFFRAYRRCEAVFVMTHGRFAANLPIVWALSRLVLLRLNPAAREQYLDPDQRSGGEVGRAYAPGDRFTVAPD